MELLYSVPQERYAKLDHIKDLDFCMFLFHYIDAETKNEVIHNNLTGPAGNL